MKTLCRMLKRDSKGFTLVELMVVLLIIGILVAIAIPIYIKTQDNAKRKTCAANIRTIEGAIIQYCAETGKDRSVFNKDNWEQILVEGKDYGEEDNKLKGLKLLKEKPECPDDKGEYTINDEGMVICTHHSED